jgi:hypothetical protein
MVLLQPTQVDQSARMPGGVLAKSLPAPPGWERGGIAIPFYGCGEPVVRDKCVQAEDVPNQNAPVGSFPSFPIEQGAMCSTTGPDSVLPSAQARFTATADWAVSRQLQQDLADTGAPSLDDAGLTVLGTAADADFALAVGCLEQAAADAGFGAVWVIHTTVRGASYLAQQGLLTIDGFSPAGAKVIIGTGYENPAATTVRLWATGQVWASVSEIEPVVNVAYRQNNLEAWARGVGVAAFDPCVNIAVDVTVPACP